MFSLDQYRTARRAAAVVDRSDRGKISVTGTDRASYLQGLLTNDIASLTPGMGCYSAYLTPQGRMIADLRLLELGDRLLLDLHPAVTAPVLARFEEFVFSEDVRFADETASWALFGVHGPRAAAVVAAVLARGVESARARPDEAALAGYVEHQNSCWTFAESPLVVARSDDTGLAGFDLYVDRRGGSGLSEALRAAGAEDLSPATMEVLRVEAGRPAFTVDMDGDTIPLEAGIQDRAISFTKGCYVGQEVVIRILHRGHGRVARRLVGLTVDLEPGRAERVPAHGDRICSGDRDVGRVTSGVSSPALGRAIALGYVHRELAEPGTRVEILHAGTRLGAGVTALPFVSAPDPER